MCVCTVPSTIVPKSQLGPLDAIVITTGNNKQVEHNHPGWNWPRAVWLAPLHLQEVTILAETLVLHII